MFFTYDPGTSVKFCEFSILDLLNFTTLIQRRLRGTEDAREALIVGRMSHKWVDHLRIHVRNFVKEGSSKVENGFVLSVSTAGYSHKIADKLRSTPLVVLDSI